MNAPVRTSHSEHTFGSLPANFHDCIEVFQAVLVIGITGARVKHSPTAAFSKIVELFGLLNRESSMSRLRLPYSGGGDCSLDATYMRETA